MVRTHCSFNRDLELVPVVCDRGRHRDRGLTRASRPVRGQEEVFTSGYGVTYVDGSVDVERLSLLCTPPIFMSLSMPEDFLVYVLGFLRGWLKFLFQYNFRDQAPDTKLPTTIDSLSINVILLGVTLYLVTLLAMSVDGQSRFMKLMSTDAPRLDGDTNVNAYEFLVGFHESRGQTSYCYLRDG